MTDGRAWRRWAGVAWILAMHLAGLFSYPRIEADEGGWPLAVRLWVEQGTPTKDYYMAPGYHWLLGAAFSIFGASHTVSRPVSAVVGLAALWLFYRLTRHLAGEQAAWWSTLLAGTSHTVLLVMRRAYIEPFQVFLLLAVALVVVRRRPARWWPVAAAGLTALLLLTKASGVFLAPVLVLAAWLDAPQENESRWRRAAAVAGAVGAGAAIAAAVFGWLYWSNPAGFLEGWTYDMALARGVGGQVRTTGSRLGVNPMQIELMWRALAGFDPLLLGLAGAGLCRAVADGLRPSALMPVWLAGGAAFLGLQMYVAPQHRVIVMPALCYLAGWFLASSSDEQMTTQRRRWWQQSWPRLCLVLAMTVSAVRWTALAWRFEDVTAPAVAWLRRQPGVERAAVAAAPYLLMQLPGVRPVSFFRLPAPYLPEPARLAAAQGVEWVVVDDREWRHHMKDAGAGDERIAAALEACCELAYTAPGARVYRVRVGGGK